VLNGHLDSFPAGDRTAWSLDPFGGIVRNGRLYGRGAADMKAGLAAGIATSLLLARYRDLLAGELVLVLVADEETGGRFGTQYLLANDPDAIGDAMINGDAGSPEVLRFGEKGQLRIAVTATGRSSHGAHTHLGDNAIERLLAALDRLFVLCLNFGFFSKPSASLPSAGSRFAIRRPGSSPDRRNDCAAAIVRRPPLPRP